MITKTKNFIAEVLVEMKKVSWTTRRELIDSSLVVVFSALSLGLFVAIIDFVLSKGVATVLK